LYTIVFVFFFSYSSVLFTNMLIEHITKPPIFRKAPVTTAICCTCFFAWFLQLVGFPVEKVFSLIVSNTMIERKYLWNLITSGFLETNMVSMALSVCAFYLVGGNLEAKWSSPQYVTFLISVQLFAGLCTLMLHTMLYIILESEGYLYRKMHGTWGLIVALLVALVQSFPASSVPHLSHVKLRYLPIAFVVACTVMRSIMFLELPFIYFSFLGSILYLKSWRFGRFMSGNVPCLELKFEDFFPPPLNRPARALASVVLIVRNSVCGNPSGGRYGNSAIPATPHQVAERRRAKALRMLDQKLAEIDSSSLSSPQMSYDSKKNVTAGPGDGLLSNPSGLEAHKTVHTV
jgi:membrane associated rhomboid family serine protease